MSQNITVTVEPSGTKFQYRVFLDGVEVEQRVSVKRYVVVHVQRWACVGEHTDGDRDFGAPDAFAARFASKPKAQGSKIEYGFCAQNVVITNA